MPVKPNQTSFEIKYRCPACQGQLAQKQAVMRCAGCRMEYPILLDIPDLRYPRPEISAAELAKLERMAAEFNQLSLHELLEIFLAGARLSPRIKEKTLDYYFKQDQRSEDMCRMFLTNNGKAFGPFPQNTALDLGCGAGGGALALLRSFKRVLAVDADMGQLILAKKAIGDSGQPGIRLLCALAERLPLEDSTFNYVQCDNVIEHLVANLVPVFQEIHRVLVVDGRFSADSRNRFDLFLPEPHSGIRWLGFLPQRWIPSAVRLMTGNHYEQTRLLSLPDLRRAASSVFHDYQVDLPDLSAYGKTGKWDRRAQRILSIRVVNQILLPVFSAHILVARKQAGVDPHEN